MIFFLLNYYHPGSWRWPWISCRNWLWRGRPGWGWRAIGGGWSSTSRAIRISVGSIFTPKGLPILPFHSFGYLMKEMIEFLFMNLYSQFLNYWWIDLTLVRTLPSRTRGTTRRCMCSAARGARWGCPASARVSSSTAARRRRSSLTTSPQRASSWTVGQCRCRFVIKNSYERHYFQKF